MKLQYKTTGSTIVIGIITLSLITYFYAILNQNTIIRKELQNIKNTAEDSAQHMGSHLEGNAAIAKTLSNAPILRDALLESNAEFGVMSTEERIAFIQSRNRQWQETKNIEDPFIQKYMNNPVAKFLKMQQRVFSGLYGEIFLTNRYGVMIATTGKLTTLAHAHKYWWKESYSDGNGRVSLMILSIDSTSFFAFLRSWVTCVITS